MLMKHPIRCVWAVVECLAVFWSLWIAIVLLFLF